MSDHRPGCPRYSGFGECDCELGDEAWLITSDCAQLIASIPLLTRDPDACYGSGEPTVDDPVIDMAVIVDGEHAATSHATMFNGSSTPTSECLRTAGANQGDGVATAFTLSKDSCGTVEGHGIDSRGHGVQGDPATRLLGAEHETAARTTACDCFYCRNQFGSAACVPDAAAVSSVAQSGDTETFARPAHDAGRSTEQPPCVGETPASISPLDAGTLLRALKDAQRHLHMYVGNAYENMGLGFWCKECLEIQPQNEDGSLKVVHNPDCWTYSAIKADLAAQDAIEKAEELFLWADEAQASSVADVSASAQSAVTEAGGSTDTERVTGTSSVSTSADKSVEYPASDWISTMDDMPSQGQWCWVVYEGVVQRQAARLNGRMWEWADDSADYAPLEVISHWQPMTSPPQANAVAGSIRTIQGNESEVDYEGGTGAVANRKPPIEQTTEGAAQSASAPSSTPDAALPMILANSTFLLSRALAHFGEVDLNCARDLAIAISNHIADIHAYAYTKDISFEFVQAQFDLIKKWN